MHTPEPRHPRLYVAPESFDAVETVRSASHGPRLFYDRDQLASVLLQFQAPQVLIPVPILLTVVSVSPKHGFQFPRLAEQ